MAPRSPRARHNTRTPCKDGAGASTHRNWGIPRRRQVRANGARAAYCGVTARFSFLERPWQARFPEKRRKRTLLISQKQRPRQQSCSRPARPAAVLLAPCEQVSTPCAASGALGNRRRSWSVPPMFRPRSLRPGAVETPAARARAPAPLLPRCRSHRDSMARKLPRLVATRLPAAPLTRRRAAAR